MESLEVILNYENDNDKNKRAYIIINENGMSIVSEKNLSIGELHLFSSIAFVYLGTYEKGIILDNNTVAEYGFRLYEAFQKNYQGLKSLKDMSLDEFNDIMKKYNGRKNNNGNTE